MARPTDPATLNEVDRLYLCVESVQRAMSRLFDRGFSAGEIATAQLQLFSSYSVIGMGRKEAAAALRAAAAELESAADQGKCSGMAPG